MHPSGKVDVEPVGWELIKGIGGNAVVGDDPFCLGDVTAGAAQSGSYLAIASGGEAEGDDLFEVCLVRGF